MKVNTDKAVRGFYVIVLGTALAGSVSAAAKWLEVDWRLAILPIVAVELGGVVLMMYAADRQKLGERATVARLLSAGVAGMAVATNYFGHQSKPGQAYFFAGLSLLGYVVYLLMAGAARRDALRATGKLEETTPVYGLWQWLRHPGVTRRARLLAQANAATRLAEGDHPTTPRLGRGASLAAAVHQARAEKRENAIAKALDRLIRDAAGPVMADIAVHTYDPDQIAQRIAAAADYDGYAGLLSGRLTPAKLAGDETPVEDDIAAVMDATAPTLSEQVEAVVSRHLDALPMAGPEPVVNRPRWRPGGHLRPRRMSRPQPAINVTVMAPERLPKPASDTGQRGRSTTDRKPANRPATTADKVAAELAKKPAMTQADVAKVLGLGVRTVGRHWAAAKATVNGHDHGTEQ